ncbi:MAG: HU family DNA-binding protein [Candidatus Firestonebacteria bacterium]
MNITKRDLVRNVAQLGINNSLAKKSVQTLLDSIVNSLKSGEKVQISKFGTFIIREKRERIGRNPKTGEKVIIPAKKIPAFKPSKILKRQIEKGEISYDRRV